MGSLRTEKGKTTPATKDKPYSNPTRKVSFESKKEGGQETKRVSWNYKPGKTISASQVKDRGTTSKAATWNYDSKTLSVRQNKGKNKKSRGASARLGPLSFHVDKATSGFVDPYGTKVTERDIEKAVELGIPIDDYMATLGYREGRTKVNWENTYGSGIGKGHARRTLNLGLQTPYFSAQGDISPKGAGQKERTGIQATTRVPIGPVDLTVSGRATNQRERELQAALGVGNLNIQGRVTRGGGRGIGASYNIGDDLSIHGNIDEGQGRNIGLRFQKGFNFNKGGKVKKKRK